MREVTSQEEKPARRARIWPHALILVGEMLLQLAALVHFDWMRHAFWTNRYDQAAPPHSHLHSAAHALTIVLGVLTAYQLVQTIRRKAQVLTFNTRRCQLMIALGIIASGASIINGVYGTVFMLWGLFCLWAYTSLDFVKRPFDRE
jgi:hypothetical protein